MTFERVVCLVDGSAAGLEALRQAALLRDPGGELIGVVACDLGLAAEAGFEAKHAARQLEEEALEAREAAEDVLAGQPSATVEIVNGRTAPALLGAAAGRDAELLVLGVRPGKHRRGLVLGSLVTEMIHEAACPVLVARASYLGAWLPRTIAVGVDGSDRSRDALEVARALGARLGASVRAIGATRGKRVDRQALLALGEVELVEHPPVEALAAASESSDLLVVGSHGLHGLASLGSVSERVAHRAVCSVLLVRREPAAEERSVAGALSLRRRRRRAGP
jgi:nucleotide-binding universal stress UspA family protein